MKFDFRPKYFVVFLAAAVTAFLSAWLISSKPWGG